MNAIGENRDVAMLRLRIDYLKNRCAEEIEEYTSYVTIRGENIRAIYMLKIGCLEGTVLELEIEAMRWRRRLELRQAALNRGAVPDLAAIERIVNEEIAVYREALERKMEELENAKRLRDAEKLSDEEVTEIRVGYLNAAKKLHPDLNPELSESAKSLWNMIQKAYRDKEWTQVRFLTTLVDDVLGGTVEIKETGTIEALKAEIAALEKKLGELQERKRALFKTKPFSYKELIDDDEAVARRQEELKMRIDYLEETIADYKGAWEAGKEAA